MTKININSASIMRIRECFDFLRIYDSELTDSQRELVKSLRKQHIERGLSDKQEKILLDIARFPKTDESLNEKHNY